jgi:hypothetical protein
LYETLSRQFVAAKAELKTAQEGLERLRKDRETVVADQPEARVEAALNLLNDITRIADDPAARAEVNPLLRRLGVLIGLSFAPAVKGEKRKIQRLVGGRIVFGDGPLSVPLYGKDNVDGGPSEAPHTRHATGNGDMRKGIISRTGVDSEDAIGEEKSSEGRRKKPGAGKGVDPELASGGGDRSPHRPNECRPEGVSTTKGSRADRIRTCDLLVP